ncbi:MAG: hypothetical protein OEY28_10850 [Nitrospira sp.]|nr:hypothetical protein [Nitrospira sp.]
MYGLLASAGSSETSEAFKRGEQIGNTLAPVLVVALVIGAVLVAYVLIRYWPNFALSLRFVAGVLMIVGALTVGAPYLLYQAQAWAPKTEYDAKLALILVGIGLLGWILGFVLSLGSYAVGYWIKGARPVRSSS